MRRLVAAALLGGLAFVAHFTYSTADAAERVQAQVASMTKETGREMGEVGYRVVADRYPFALAAVSARRELALLRAPMVSKDASTDSDPVLGDPLFLSARPYVGPLALAAAAGFVLTLVLLRRQSRARGRAALLLLVLGATLVATQANAGLATCAELNEEFAVSLYACFPWVAAGIAVAAALLTAVRPCPRPRVVN
jgi:hypothetical protein